MSALAQQQALPRSEMLMMKQLVFSERYGKMFLGDRPLVYDRTVHEALLERPMTVSPT